jgi:hypothetical protein
LLNGKSENERTPNEKSVYEIESSALPTQILQLFKAIVA